MSAAHIKELWIYPVKSMAGCLLETAKVSEQGLCGDRRFAFQVGQGVRAKNVTARRFPQLLAYRPRLVSQDIVGPSDVRVTCPDGNEFTLDDRRLLQHIRSAFGRDVRLVEVPAGAVDEAPVSMISTNSIRSIEKSLGQRLSLRQFRPNVAFEVSESSLFPEDEWVGGVIVLGQGRSPVRLRVSTPTARCVIASNDPESNKKNSRLLPTIKEVNCGNLGVYAAVQTTGSVEVGAPVSFVASIVGS